MKRLPRTRTPLNQESFVSSGSSLLVKIDCQNFPVTVSQELELECRVDPETVTRPFVGDWRYSHNAANAW